MPANNAEYSTQAVAGILGIETIWLAMIWHTPHRALPRLLAPYRLLAVVT